MRGLSVVTGQYSSLCMSAVVSIPCGSDQQDREQIDNERKKVEPRKREREKERKKTKREQATDAQTCDIMDDMAHQRHLEP